tara:strand:- start:1791 stop:2003 length:213 start_codon:yes stop_codon:yes gene_type:complete
MNATEVLDFNCNDDNIKFYISLGINFALTLLTVVSEGMASSKCKSNGIIHGLKKSLSQTQDLIRNDIESN